MSRTLRFTDMHAAIMNLSCKVPQEAIKSTPLGAYKLGYRDARHAAAELATEQDALVDELVAECRAAEQIYAHLKMWPLLDKLRAVLTKLEQTK